MSAVMRCSNAAVLQQRIAAASSTISRRGGAGTQRKAQSVLNVSNAAVNVCSNAVRSTAVQYCSNAAASSTISRRGGAETQQTADSNECYRFRKCQQAIGGPHHRRVWLALLALLAVLAVLVVEHKCWLSAVFAQDEMCFLCVRGFMSE